MLPFWSHYAGGWNLHFTCQSCCVDLGGWLLQGTKIERGDVTDEADLRSKLQLVLLDFGLAEELTPPVRYRFLSFLHSIAGGHGRRAGEHMLHMGQNAKCPDKQGFLRNMAVLFREHCDIQAPGGIDVDKVRHVPLRLDITPLFACNPSLPTPHVIARPHGYKSHEEAGLKLALRKASSMCT